MNQFDYHYDENKKILFFSWSGVTSTEQLVNSWKHILDNSIKPNNCHAILCNRVNVNITDLREKLILLIDFHTQNLSIFNNCRVAILTNKPKLVANFFLLNHKLKNKQIKIFTTEAGALKWLNEFAILHN